MKGSSSNPHVDSNLGWRNLKNYDNHGRHGSEWNRLMYPIHSGFSGNVNNPYIHSDVSTLPFNSFHNYSNSDFIMYPGTGPGYHTLMQETSSTKTNECLRCGSEGVMSHITGSKSSNGSELGWRPVLELVS